MQKYTELRKVARISLSEHVPLRAPMTMFVEPTNVCNFECVYCPESLPDYVKIASGYHKMALSDFENIAKQVKDLGKLKTLNLYMVGEPLALSYMPEFVRVAKEYDIADRVILTTNGSLLNEENSQKLVEYGLDFLRISCYGGYDKEYSNRTQTDFTTENIVKNVEMFQKQNKTKQNKTKQNKTKQNKTKQNKTKQNKTFVYVKMIDTQDEKENEFFIKRFQDIADEVVIEPVMNWNDFEDHNFANMDKELLLKSQFFLHRKRVCPSPFYTLIVHSDLKVSPCCADWNKGTVIGDLKTESLREIWSGAKMNELRLFLLRGRKDSEQTGKFSSCMNCSFLHTLPDNMDDLSAEEYLGRIS